MDAIHHVGRMGESSSMGDSSCIMSMMSGVQMSMNLWQEMLPGDNRRQCESRCWKKQVRYGLALFPNYQ